jgi:hypothetical protein
MKNTIQPSANMQVLGHVLFDVFESVVTQVLLDVRGAPGQQIVEHDNRMPVRD